MIIAGFTSTCTGTTYSHASANTGLSYNDTITLSWQRDAQRLRERNQRPYWHWRKPEVGGVV